MGGSIVMVFRLRMARIHGLIDVGRPPRLILAGVRFFYALLGQGQ